MKEFLVKRKKTIIAFCVIAGIAGIAIVSVNYIKTKQNALLEKLNEPEITSVERRTLVSSLSATGVITSLESKDVVVDSNLKGLEIIGVMAEVGDMVEEGQVIVAFDSSDVEENLNEARTSLAVITEKTEIKLETEERNLENATEDYHLSLRRANTDVNAAYNDYIVALEEYKDQGMSDEDAKKAASGLLKAYDSQKRALEDAEKRVENSVITSTDSLTIAKLDALSSTDAQEDTIELYEQQLKDCRVEAPFNGVITAMNVEEKDIYNGTVLFTIEDISGFEVKTEIDEYDINKVKAGQRVVIKTNATADEEVQGTVKTIAPRATKTGTEVTYRVTISVDSKSDMLRMDMTAKMSIIIESRENVLTVPFQAVQQEEDRYYVEVIERSDASDEEDKSYSTSKVYVTKGLESDYYVEIMGNDLQEGREILLPKAEGTGLEELGLIMMESGAMGGF